MYIYIYIYIYIYMYNYIYIYIYIYITIYIIHTLLHTGHTAFTFIIYNLSYRFYLIIVTSRNSLPNCEHDPIYQ